jgi:hypothetical protein
VEDILPLKTIKAAVKLADGTNNRDRENYKQVVYNIESFTYKLETLDKLSRYHFILDKSTICPRCESAEETNDHILKCVKTVANYNEILATATIILQAELDKAWKQNEILQAKYTKPTVALVWEALEANTPQVFDKPIAKGILTQSLLDSFKERVLKESTTLAQSSRNPPFITEDTIEIATAALTAAIYQEIWLPRTKYIFSKNSNLEYIEKINKKTQAKRDKKEKRAQEKKERQAHPKPAPKKKERQREKLFLKRDIKEAKKATEEITRNILKKKQRGPPATNKKAKKQKTYQIVEIADATQKWDTMLESNGVQKIHDTTTKKRKRSEQFPELPSGKKRKKREDTQKP